MVYPTKLDNGLVRWQSDNGLKIRNEQTGGEYDYADDLPNEIRIKQGLEAYSYVETDIPIYTGNDYSQTMFQTTPNIF